NLGSDVRVQTDDLHAVHELRAAADLGHVRDRDAELVRLEAGGNVRMGPGVDVRIDADRDPRPGPALAGQRVDPFDLPPGLDVDAAHAQVDRAREFRGCLAYAREDDLHRRESGAHRDVDLANRVRVGAAAERPQQAQDRERRVRLQRV